MENFEIKINGIVVNSKDIISFIRKCRSEDAIKYIVDETNCNVGEAEVVVNELKQMLHDKSMGGAGIRNREITSSLKENSTCYNKKIQVTCPYCKSTNAKKISAVSRAGSILGFGLFSKKLGKQWHCNNCNSDF